jgi:hypothetical protein
VAWRGGALKKRLCAWKVVGWGGVSGASVSFLLPCREGLPGFSSLTNRKKKDSNKPGRRALLRPPYPPTMFKKNTTIKETRLLSGKDAKTLRKRLEAQFAHLDGGLGYFFFLFFSFACPARPRTLQQRRGLVQTNKAVVMGRVIISRRAPARARTHTNTLHKPPSPAPPLPPLHPPRHTYTHSHRRRPGPHPAAQGRHRHPQAVQPAHRVRCRRRARPV